MILNFGSSYFVMQECGRILETRHASSFVGGGLSSESGTRADCIYEPVQPSTLEELPTVRDSNIDYARVRSMWPLSERVALDILFSERIRGIVSILLGTGDDTRLFNEQYIVKPSHSGARGAFGWHRDADSLNIVDIIPEDVTYVSLWVALDDMTKENGCLVVRPLTGSQEERTLELPRGSAVVMSHLLYHKSGPNKTNFQRRAWMPQFSKGPILDHTKRPVSLAILMP